LRNHPRRLRHHRAHHVERESFLLNLPRCPALGLWVPKAENLCHQPIFVDDATHTVVAPDPEMIQVGGAIRQWPKWRGLVQGAVRPVGVVEVLELPQTIIRRRWFQIRVRSTSSRRQLLIHRSMTEFIWGAGRRSG